MPINNNSIKFDELPEDEFCELCIVVTAPIDCAVNSNIFVSIFEYELSATILQPKRKKWKKLQKKILKY